jgi:hypothetical protein
VAPDFEPGTLADAADDQGERIATICGKPYIRIVSELY